MLVKIERKQELGMIAYPRNDDEVRSASDEQDFVLRAASGDMRAFRSLYDLHLGYVTRNVARLLGPSAEVEDVVQDVFIHVYRLLGSYGGDLAFTTWLYRVTRNVTIDHLRKRRVNTVELDAWRPLKGDTDQWSALEAHDLCRVLHAVLKSVGVEYREAFLLHEVEGMKLREIADLTEESINTVAARIRRTREKLQGLLELKLREVDHI